MGAGESRLRVFHDKKIRIPFFLWFIWIQRIFLSLRDSGGPPVKERFIPFFLFKEDVWFEGQIFQRMRITNSYLEKMVSCEEIGEVVKRKDIDAVLCPEYRSTRIDNDPAA